MFGLFSKAHANLNLSPAERSILRLVDGVVVTFLASAFVAGLQQLALGQVNWSLVGLTALVAGGKDVINALLKYVRAHKDSPIAQALEPVLQQGQATLTGIEQANDLKEPLVAPDFINNPLPDGVPDPTA